MKTLREPKKCSCGEIHTCVPSTARKGDTTKDEFPGYYWECFCGSTLFLHVPEREKCDCTDCEDSETPCEMDCDGENECIGCCEARFIETEHQYDIDCATGRK